jgi:cell wall-associated NlpC family hydrolase
VETQQTTSTTSTSPSGEPHPGLEPELELRDFDHTDFLPPSNGEPGGVAGTFEDLVPHTGPMGGVRQRVVDVSKALKGVPFQFGGEDPDAGFDAPGFTRYVLKQAGIDLPRFPHQQAEYGEAIPLEHAQAGDLVAWESSRRNAGAPHVAVYLGDNQIIEAPKPGMGVRVRELAPDEGAVGISLNY